MFSMQDVTERPQFGGVISRIFVLSRCSALLEGKTATWSPSSPRVHRNRPIATLEDLANL